MTAQKGDVLLRQGKLGHDTLVVVPENAVAVDMLHIGHGGTALVHMDMADIHAPAAQRVQQGCAASVRPYRPHIGDTVAQAAGVDGHVDGVAAEMILACLTVVIHTVIAHASDPFHSSSLTLSMAHFA